MVATPCTVTRVLVHTHHQESDEEHVQYHDDHSHLEDDLQEAEQFSDEVSDEVHVSVHPFFHVHEVVDGGVLAFDDTPEVLDLPLVVGRDALHGSFFHVERMVDGGETEECEESVVHDYSFLEQEGETDDESGEHQCFDEARTVVGIHVFSLCV